MGAARVSIDVSRVILARTYALCPASTHSGVRPYRLPKALYPPCACVARVAAHCQVRRRDACMDAA